MHPILECAACAVLVFLVTTLLFAVGAACIIIHEGVRAVVHATHGTLESASQTAPRVAALAARGAGSWGANERRPPTLQAQVIE